MKTPEYDFLIIGAGHNGLVAAAYLAQAGRRVLVLERRQMVGGSLVSEEFGHGFRADALWPGGMLRPDIVQDLRLALPPTAKLPFISLLPDGQRLQLDADPLQAAAAIRRFSEKDAARWPAFVQFMQRAARFLDEIDATIMPRLPKGMSVREGLGLAGLGLDLRRMGRRDMLRFIRMLPMTAVELLEEWFESGPLKAALASLAIHGVTLGPMSAGTGFTLLHNWRNRGGLAHARAGGAGAITAALAEAAARFGGEIRVGRGVARIQVEGCACTGVVLEGGEEISAGAVLSAVDPKRTFLSLVHPLNLPPEFVWKTQSIKMRGSVSKLHLLTDGSHGVPEGTVVLAPSLEYLERAYDAAKYGEISKRPYLELTTHGNVVSIHVQFTPYALKASNWDSRPPDLEGLVLDALKAYLPQLRSSIVDRRLLTPRDLEMTYGLTEGDLNHGQLMLDQFLFMRPIPGWSNHRTPIENLYLCGSGVHGGGGVSGAAGRNAARVVLRAG
ncbi:MAG TPA: NAD(P)/FAD-dependent oxidoreductase [Anaerolineales bacterium]|nr:NAD(P)/FAD-dependent oxidoreductase [Anaerolineales bacterium]